MRARSLTHAIATVTEDRVVIRGERVVARTRVERDLEPALGGGLMPEHVDALIEGTVITMDADRRVIRDGAVAVRDGRIAAVGEADELRARFAAEKSLGGARRFVIPGLIDCHNHLAQALVRDYALEDLPNIYRIYIPAEMAMDVDDARVSAQVGIAQLLRAGVTTVAETTCTPEHEEPIAQTVMETGIRCAMARGTGDRIDRARQQLRADRRDLLLP